MDDHTYEIPKKDSFPMTTPGKGTQQPVSPAPTATTNKKSWKHYLHWLATLFNFILIIGIGAVVLYYQTKTASEVSQVQRIHGSSNISGPPGPQGSN